MIQDVVIGTQTLARSIRLLNRPGGRVYVIMPLLINLVLFLFNVLPAYPIRENSERQSKGSSASAWNAGPRFPTLPASPWPRSDWRRRWPLPAVGSVGKTIPTTKSLSMELVSSAWRPPGL